MKEEGVIHLVETRNRENKREEMRKKPIAKRDLIHAVASTVEVSPSGEAGSYIEGKAHVSTSRGAETKESSSPTMHCESLQVTPAAPGRAKQLTDPTS